MCTRIIKGPYSVNEAVDESISHGIIILIIKGIIDGMICPDLISFRQEQIRRSDPCKLPSKPQVA